MNSESGAMNLAKVRGGVVLFPVASDRRVQRVRRHIERIEEAIDVVGYEVVKGVEGGSGVLGSCAADSLGRHVEAEVSADVLEREKPHHGGEDLSVLGVLNTI